MAQDSSKTRELLRKIAENVSHDDPRIQNYLSALEKEIEADAEQRAESDRMLAEFEEAYNKLTSPANRIGVFLKWAEESEEKYAQISVGDTEFLAQIDPKVDAALLTPGTRIRVNDAYAIVGIIEPSLTGGMIKVSEVMPDGRLRVGSETPGSEGRLVMRSSNLENQAIHSGDEVRLDSSGRFAVEHIERQESKDYFLEEVPNIPWEKVGGQDSAIRLIRDTIEQPLLHPEIFERFEKKPIKGILLYGPPGCGKTLLGKATAYNLTQEYSKRLGKPVKEYFMAISGPKILNMWLGETERMVRDIFKTAREKAKEGRLVFIFMDEAESVLRTRSSGRWLNISNTVVPQFCAELDGLQSLDNVVLMLTSNRPDYIDPAVLRPERIDRKVKISRPDKASTQQILGIYLHEGIPLESEVVAKWNGEIDCARKDLIERLTDVIWSKSKETEFLRVHLKNGHDETLYWRDLVSGALLKSIVDRAKDYAIKRAIADPEKLGGISFEDLERATVAEYKENEIFPKSETQEDWLQLLDYEPENVASVRPIGRKNDGSRGRRTVI